MTPLDLASLRAGQSGPLADRDYEVLALHPDPGDPTGRTGSALVRSGAGYAVVSGIDVSGLACDRVWRPPPGALFAVGEPCRLAIRRVPHLVQLPPPAAAAA